MIEQPIYTMMERKKREDAGKSRDKTYPRSNPCYPLLLASLHLLKFPEPPPKHCQLGIEEPRRITFHIPLTTVDFFIRSYFLALFT